MKKLILISLLTLGSSLFAADLGVRIQTPLGNGGMLDIGFKSDDHRYDNRYRNFDYNRNGYYDDFGYFFGYFDKIGYFYNNIFFTYDNRYTYYDRLHHGGYFRPNKVHYRTYEYHKHNDWNRSHNYREQKKPIYGPYYERNNDKRKVVEKQYNDKNYKNDRNYKNNSNNHDNKSRNNNDRYEEKNYRNHQDNNKHNR
ncbi:hypothetical protein KKG81_12495 [bacterium]|jgi:hypothetical protein|nr:hypothetical protein [bacterium]